MRSTKNFTLIETFVALFIAAILTLIAVPVFTRAAERGKAQEAVNVLHILRGSQLRYAADNGSTASSLSDLDVELTDLSAHFDSLEVMDVDPETNPSAAIAQINRTNVANPGYGRYRLLIDSNGTISCIDEGSFGGCGVLNL
jgi:type II secretory pathway pseudopilin PulG